MQGNLIEEVCALRHRLDIDCGLVFVEHVSTALNWSVDTRNTDGLKVEGCAIQVTLLFLPRMDSMHCVDLADSAVASTRRHHPLPRMIETT